MFRGEIPYAAQNTRLKWGPVAQAPAGGDRVHGEMTQSRVGQVPEAAFQPAGADQRGDPATVPPGDPPRGWCQARWNAMDVTGRG